MACTTAHLQMHRAENKCTDAKTNAQLCNCTTVQVLQCSNAQMHECTNAQLLKYTTVQVLECTNAQMHNCTSAQMHKCTNAQLPNCTTAQLQSASKLALRPFESRDAVHDLSQVDSPPSQRRHQLSLDQLLRTGKVYLLRRGDIGTQLLQNGILDFPECESLRPNAKCQMPNAKCQYVNLSICQYVNMPVCQYVK